MEFMYKKAMLFGETDIVESILLATTPQKCKDLGRSRKIAFNEEVWVKHRERIYREVLMDKFSVPKYKKQLLKTGTKHIVESSPFDKIWGIGMWDNDPDVENPEKWLGLNLLGKVLMEVRELMVEEQKGKIGTGKGG